MGESGMTVRRWSLRVGVALAVLAVLYVAAGALYWRGVGAGKPLQAPMVYPEQYTYPRAWTRAQLAPGIPDPTPFAAVYGPNIVAQSFRSCCPHLAMVRVWLGGAAGQRVAVSLRAGPDRSDTLYHQEITLDRDGYYPFAFPSQPDSAGKVYYLVIEAPGADADHPVAMRVIPTEQVGGSPSLNGYGAAGNVDLISYHRGKPGPWVGCALAEQVVPSTAATRIQQYKPRFVKGDAFGWLLGTSALATGAWLVLAWPGRGRRCVLVSTAAVIALCTGAIVLSGALYWPVHAPSMLPSHGELLPPATAPQGRLVRDLLLDLASAGHDPARRHFATAWTAVDGRRVPCIAAPPESELRYGVRLPPGASLHLWMAVEEPGAWRRFEVLDGSGAVLTGREVRGPEYAFSTVDLGRYAGQSATLRLRTEGDGESEAPGLWCAPQIESPHAWLLPYPVTIELTPQYATFGGVLELFGYDLEPAEQPTLTLYWRARQRVAIDYTVFVHLLDASGQLVGAYDSQPVGGAYPTSVWSPEYVVRDRRLLSLPDGLAAGEYRIEVGLYDLATMERLPASDGEGVSLPGDRVLLDDALVEGMRECDGLTKGMDSGTILPRYQTTFLGLHTVLLARNSADLDDTAQEVNCD